QPCEPNRCSRSANDSPSPPVPIKCRMKSAECRMKPLFPFLIVHFAFSNLHSKTGEGAFLVCFTPNCLPAYGFRFLMGKLSVTICTDRRAYRKLWPCQDRFKSSW